MLISARVTWQPKKGRYCDECGRRIYGAHIRLYGAAHCGDPPYNLYSHPGCFHPSHLAQQGSSVLRIQAELSKIAQMRDHRGALVRTDNPPTSGEKDLK